MASIRKEIETAATAEQVWDALRDVGALHTRLVPGFVVDTKLEGEERVVRFGNGMVVREPILSIDDGARRVAWAAVAESLKHYSASAQVFSAEGRPTRVVWIADFLPHEAAADIEIMMEQGIAVMKKTLDRLAER